MTNCRHYEYCNTRKNAFIIPKEEFEERCVVSEDPDCEWNRMYDKELSRQDSVAHLEREASELQ